MPGQYNLPDPGVENDNDAEVLEKMAGKLQEIRQAEWTRMSGIEEYIPTISDMVMHADTRYRLVMMEIDEANTMTLTYHPIRDG